MNFQKWELFSGSLGTYILIQLSLRRETNDVELYITNNLVFGNNLLSYNQGCSLPRYKHDSKICADGISLWRSTKRGYDV